MKMEDWKMWDQMLFVSTGTNAADAGWSREGLSTAL